jgi:hypothetical protein
MQRLKMMVVFQIICIFLASCTVSPTASLSLATHTPLAPTSTATDVSFMASSPMSATPTALPDVRAKNVASYQIQVQLIPGQHHLSGVETIRYQNTGKKAIPDLVFHLYLNAFKNTDTIFMKESGGQLRGQPFNEAENGWIEVKSIQMEDGAPLVLNPVQDGTLARAALPTPLPPGQEITINLAFEAQLPRVFARTGWAPDAAGDPFFLVGQWFHGNSEFFSDFGDYQVSITTPEDYQVGATGMPVGQQKHGNGTQTVSYFAQGVIDFAWVTSPNLKSERRMVGKTELLYLYLPEHSWSVERALNAAEAGLTQFSEWYGNYPYPRLTVVDVPEEGMGAGGMEYPTFITAGASGDGSEPAPTDFWSDGLAITTIHEVAHQWFQSMLASNEAEEPWLDEGFADYSTVRLLIAKDGLPDHSLDRGDFPVGFLAGRRQSFLNHADVPMFGKAWEFPSWGDYVAASYAKPDVSLLTLERQVGEAVMTDILRTYFTRYQYGHPTTDDFEAVAVEVSGQPLNWFFDGLVRGHQTVNYVARSINDETIEVAREGDLVLPVEIEVTFEDGSKESVVWDAKDTEKTFKFGHQSEVRSFRMDPNHKVLIELDWEDNILPKH